MASDSLLFRGSQAADAPSPSSGDEGGADHGLLAISRGVALRFRQRKESQPKPSPRALLGFGIHNLMLQMCVSVGLL